MLKREIICYLIFSLNIDNDFSKAWLEGLNDFLILYFQTFKLLLFIVLLICSFYILLGARILKYRNQSERKNQYYEYKTASYKIRIINAIAYFVIAWGFLFNFLSYFLIWSFEPIPDRLIFNVIPLVNINPFNTNLILDIINCLNPIEITSYLLIAFASSLKSLSFFILNAHLLNKVKYNQKILLYVFIFGLWGFLFGFTTYLPLIL